jgi:glucose/arabinose dehydrogenase
MVAHESIRVTCADTGRGMRKLARKFWIAITLLAAGACGSSPPPAPSPGPGTGDAQSITGRERIGWDQAADSLSELATFDYAIYVDGVRNLLADTSCGTEAGTAGFACSGRLPGMSNGSHTLQLAAFIAAGDGGVVEGSRSTSLSVTVSGLTAPSTGWTAGQVETTREGVKLRAEKIATGLDRPVDAAFAPDGRLFIAERAGRIRMVADGNFQDPDPLVLVSADRDLRIAMLSIAVDPDFSRTHFVFVVHTALSTDGPVFRLSRYRELQGRLAERAVLFETAASTAVHPSAVVRFGPDGRLYLAVNGDSSNGRLFRLSADGTMPRDQAGTTPAVAEGIADPRGLAWEPRSGLLWIADEDNGAAHVSGVEMSSPPVHAIIRGRGTLHAAIGQMTTYTGDAIPTLRNEALLASPEGYILRLHFADDDPTRIARSGRLLDNKVGPILVVTIGPDGAVYFCTDEALGRLTPVQ